MAITFKKPDEPTQGMTLPTKPSAVAEATAVKEVQRLPARGLIPPTAELGAATTDLNVPAFNASLQGTPSGTLTATRALDSANAYHRTKDMQKHNQFYALRDGKVVLSSLTDPIDILNAQERAKDYAELQEENKTRGAQGPVSIPLKIHDTGIVIDAGESKPDAVYYQVIRGPSK